MLPIQICIVAQASVPPLIQAYSEVTGFYSRFQNLSGRELFVGGFLSKITTG